MNQTCRWQLGVLLGVLGLLPVSAAPRLRVDRDPNCGLPLFQLQGDTMGDSYVLRAGEDPDRADSWTDVLELNLGEAAETWHDLSVHHHGRRFFRLERLAVSPPLMLADNFRLIDQKGYARELAREGDAKTWVLIFADRAAIASTWPEVSALSAKHAGTGTKFWYIDPRDDRATIEKAANDLGVNIPVLHDPAENVARAYRCTTLPEVVVLDGAMMIQVYRGAISERCATPGGTVEYRYLASALEKRAAGQEQTILSARPSGLASPPESFAGDTYARDIAPIFQDKCVRCHRTGDIGSFAMTDHASIAQRAMAIRRDILTGDMPPWHSDGHLVKMTNDFSLKPREAARLVAWLDAGAPRGPGADPLVENPAPPAVDWPLGEPDHKVTIDVQSVPATGTVDYRYIQIVNPNEGNKTDRWLKSVVIKPGNREVVHHALLLSITTKELLALLASSGGDFRAAGEKLGLSGYFGAYVPGMDQVYFPDGTAKRLRGDHILILQMHYTTNGKEATDQTEVGFYYADGPPPRELKTVAAYDLKFRIPAQERDHEISATSQPLAKESWIYEVSPHMHYRGSRMRFEAVFPDQSVQILASVPAYQFDWQTLYRLTNPVRLPAGTRLRCVGAFDNSPWNPKNPDPKVAVRFGEQSWEEMFIGYMNIADTQ